LLEPFDFFATAVFIYFCCCLSMLKSKNLTNYFSVILLYKSEEDVSSAGEQLTSNRIYGCEIQLRASF